jgi:hypothetical protein
MLFNYQKIIHLLRVKMWFHLLLLQILLQMLLLQALFLSLMLRVRLHHQMHQKFVMIKLHFQR